MHGSVVTGEVPAQPPARLKSLVRAVPVRNRGLVYHERPEKWREPQDHQLVQEWLSSFSYRRPVGDGWLWGELVRLAAASGVLLLTLYDHLPSGVTVPSEALPALLSNVASARDFLNAHDITAVTLHTTSTGRLLYALPVGSTRKFTRPTLELSATLGHELEIRTPEQCVRATSLRVRGEGLEVFSAAESVACLEGAASALGGVIAGALDITVTTRPLREVLHEPLANLEILGYRALELRHDIFFC